MLVASTLGCQALFKEVAVKVSLKEKFAFGRARRASGPWHIRTVDITSNPKGVALCGEPRLIFGIAVVDTGNGGGKICKSCSRIYRKKE